MEQQLIEKCLRGDVRAQTMLYECYAPRLFAVSCRYMGSQMEAEDALQEAFVKIFRSLHLYEHKGSFEGWMRRVTINTCLELLRKRKASLTESIDDHNADNASEPDAAIDSLLVEDIMKLLQAMPAGFREVLNLYIIDGYSHKEIADMLDISIDNSKQRLKRARTLLQQMLESNNRSTHDVTTGKL